MVVGLYDQDLSYPNYVPNLEMMKVFNFHHSKGDIVKLIQYPEKEELGRYNQIWYFKNYFNTKFQKTILAQDNVITYGQGIIKAFQPLPIEYQPYSPNYLVYSLLNKPPKILTKVEKHGIIRLENQDLTGYKESKRSIYIVDINPLYVNGWDLCQELKTHHNLIFLHRTAAKDLETFLQWYSIATANRNNIVVEFDYTDEFFKEFIDLDRLIFSYPDFTQKDFITFLNQYVNNIYYSIKNNKTLRYEKIYQPPNNEMKFIKLIWDWFLSKEKVSFYKFYENNNKEYNFIEKILQDKKDIRLLLKSNPYR